MAPTDSPILDCQVTLEHMHQDLSSVASKIVYKSATLRLIRNEFREIFLEIKGDNAKRTLRYQLKAIHVFKNFLSDGKASINFKDDRVTVLISNAPPSQLFTFVKLMAVKLMNGAETPKSVRNKMLSSKSHSVDDISPLTDKEVEKAKAKANIRSPTTPTDTTPTGVTKCLKRQRPDSGKVKAKKNCLMRIAEQELCSEQKTVLEAVKSGLSIFFTGSAGTGKSHLLKSIIASLPPDCTYATASTGVAACHIGGTTLHQFAGIGTGEGSFSHCLKLAQRPTSRQIWRKCRHLIIDEISMVDADFFDKLEQIAREIRNCDRPFGGIQLILCGDFFQLPPVGDDNVKFCFQSQAWDKCIQRSFELLKIHRQTDPTLINILQNIRIGRVTPEITSKLLETAGQSIERNGILATRLCTHTAHAAAINSSKLESLTSASRLFLAEDVPSSLTDTIDKQCPVPCKLTIKVGAQVMLMKNLNITKGLVNGARGVVTSFEKDGLPVVKFSDSVLKVQREKFVTKTAAGFVMTRTQIPLTLAWAFSIHKAQGLTLDCVEMSLGRVFAAGHAYVALSRVKDMKSLRVVDFNPEQVWANKSVLIYYQKFRRKVQEMQLFPLGEKTSSFIKTSLKSRVLGNRQ